MTKNRKARRAEQARQRRLKQQPSPATKRVLVNGSIVYFAQVGVVTGLKDAWSPLAALVQFSSEHPLLFPGAWVVYLLAYWLLVDVRGQR